MRYEITGVVRRMVEEEYVVTLDADTEEEAAEVELVFTVIRLLRCFLHIP